MNPINKTSRILSKALIATSILMLINCLSIGVSCRKNPGSLESQKQSNKSSNAGSHKKGVSMPTSVSKTERDRSTKRIPTLPGAEGQTKVDTLTLEILDAMADCWTSYLNDPNSGQLKDRAAQTDKVQAGNPSSNQQLKTEGR